MSAARSARAHQQQTSLNLNAWPKAVYMFLSHTMPSVDSGSVLVQCVPSVFMHICIGFTTSMLTFAHKNTHTAQCVER